MSEQDEFDWENSSRSYARKTDPVTSHEAAEKANSKKMNQNVYEVIKGFGPAGCIQDDVLAYFPIDKYGSVTPTFARLQKDKLIYRPGDKRVAVKSNRNQLIMVATIYKEVE